MQLKALLLCLFLFQGSLMAAKFGTWNTKFWKSNCFKAPNKTVESPDLNSFSNMALAQLYDASSRGNLSLVKKLLSWKRFIFQYIDWTVEPQSPLNVACRNGHLDVVKALIQSPFFYINQQDRHGSSCLHEASISGNLEVLRYALSIPGVDVNIRDEIWYTPLHKATLNNQIITVITLLQAGAFMNFQNIYSETPFLLAVSSQHEALVDYFLLYETDITGANLQDYDGNSPLIISCILGLWSSALKLIAYGVNATVHETNFGRTALHFAVEWKNMEVTEALLNIPEVDIYGRDFENKSVLDLAKGDDEFNAWFLGMVSKRMLFQ